MSGASTKRRRRAQPSLLDRYVTTCEPGAAVAAAGYHLVGCTPEGYPLFTAVKGAGARGELVYETPLFEDFIPEIFH